MGALCAAALLLPAVALRAQTTKAVVPAGQSPNIVTVEEPDAERTRQQLSSLLDRYPPALHSVLTLDPGLLGNEPYLAPYPALVSFLSSHPEVARNPAFFIGQGPNARVNQDPTTVVLDMQRDVINGVGVFLGFAMAISLLVWVIRTIVDYRRWSRLAKVQADVHTKILDRFTANEDLLAYIQSPSGSKFLQSSPIALNAAQPAVGAPLARILWSVQGGVVLLAGGGGLQFVSRRLADPASEPLHVLGVLGIALGLGFILSAVISFVISQRLGLIEPARPPRTEVPVS